MLNATYVLLLCHGQGVCTTYGHIFNNCLGYILLCVAAPGRGRDWAVLDYCGAQLFLGQLVSLNGTPLLTCRRSKDTFERASFLSIDRDNG